MPRPLRRARRARALPLPALFAGAAILAAAVLLLDDRPSTGYGIGVDLLLAALFGAAVAILAALRRPAPPRLRLVASGGRHLAHGPSRRARSAT
jgi:hypothetical protein